MLPNRPPGRAVGPVGVVLPNRGPVCGVGADVDVLGNTSFPGDAVKEFREEGAESEVTTCGLGSFKVRAV